MIKRFSAVLGAVAVAVAVSAGAAEAASVVPSASQMDCDSAAAASATAKINFTSSLNVAIARAKELGFTADQINTFHTILNQGSITDAQKSQLMMIYSEHANVVSLTTDLAKIKAVLDTRFALSAAQAAQNISCTGFTPTVVAPAVTPAPVLTPGAITLPQGAPQMGDGSVLSGK